MIGEVVDITSRMPHTSGQVKCMNCQHEWVAVAPVGTTVFDCPKCSACKGVFMGFALPEEFFMCRRCTGYLFALTRTGEICVSCGEERRDE